MEPQVDPVETLVKILTEGGRPRAGEMIVKLLATPAMERLKDISYFGSLPFARDGIVEISRWTHSIGTAMLIAAVLLVNKNIGDTDGCAILASGLLHDVGHVCFSHIGEVILQRKTGQDHNSLAHHIIDSPEIQAIVEEYAPHGGIYMVSWRWNVLLNSHLDCDNLDGISRAARAFHLDAIDWVEVLPRLLRWDGKSWIWTKDALPYIARHWDVKGKIYTIVNDAANQAYEAIMEKALAYLDPDDLMTETRALAAIEKIPAAKQIWSGLVEKRMPITIYIRTDLPFGKLDKTPRMYEQNAWFNVLQEECVSRFSVASDACLVRATQQKIFTLIAPGEETLVPMSEAGYADTDVQALLAKHYKEETSYQVCIFSRSGSNSSIPKTSEGWSPEIGIFKMIPVSMREALVLWKWELVHRISLTPMREVEITDGHVIRLRVHKQSVWRAKDEPEFNPNDIGAFEQLVDLDLDTGGVAIRTIGKHDCLERLRLTFNEKGQDPLAFLSTDGVSFGSLEELSMEARENLSIPPSISSCTNLRHLKIETWGSLGLPLEIGKLDRLKTLELKVTGFGKPRPEITMPDTMRNLASLESLTIDGGLLAIPAWIGGLKHLVKLTIRRTELREIPPSLGNLVQLELLDLAENKIASIPASLFTEQSMLQALDLHSNELDTLPDTIDAPCKLERVDICYNKFRSLPSDAYEEPEESRYKQKTLLDALVDEVPELSAFVESLPSPVPEPRPYRAGSKLSYLKEFRCHGNPLIEIPSWVAVGDLVAGNIDSTEPVRIPLLLHTDRRLGEEGHSHFTRDGLVARALHPLNLKTRHPEHADFFKRIFMRSFDVLENIDEYVDAFLADPPFFRGLIANLGKRAVPAIRERVKGGESNMHPIKLQMLRDLAENLENAGESGKVDVAFIPILPATGSNTYPMGILILAAVLASEGFTNISYIPYHQETGAADGLEPRYASYGDTIESRVAQIKARDPLILIGPVFTPFLPALIKVARKLRAAAPDSTILAGGPHFGSVKAMDEELLALCPDIDGLVIGEAEETIVDLAKARLAHEAQADLKNMLKEHPIPGIMVRGAVFQERALVESLDDLPVPHYTLLAGSTEYYELCNRRNPHLMTSFYVVGDGADAGVGEDDIYLFAGGRWNSRMLKDKLPFATINGSRGCPYRCSFCASKTHRRLKSASKIYQEMFIAHENFKTDEFVFFDPLFTTPAPVEQRRVKDLCSLLITTGLSKSIRFQIEIRCDVVLKLEQATIDHLLLAGCHVFNLGLEKGSDKALSRIDKQMKTLDHAEAIARIREAAMRNGKDVLINGTFIFGGKGETLQDVKDTLLHAFTIDIDGLAMFPLEIHPGTDDYHTALVDGVIHPGLQQYLGTEYPLYHTPDVPAEFLKRIGKIMKEILDQGEQDIRAAIHTLASEFADHRGGVLETMMTGLNRPGVSPYTMILAGTSQNVVTDIYARWFIKRLRRDVVARWREAPSMAALDPQPNQPVSISYWSSVIKEQCESLIAELQNTRPKHYEHHTGNYQDGDLERVCVKFIEEFLRIVHLFQI